MQRSQSDSSAGGEAGGWITLVEWRTERGFEYQRRAGQETPGSGAAASALSVFGERSWTKIDLSTSSSGESDKALNPVTVLH